MVTGAGDLTVSEAAGDHASLATSTLDNNFSVNRNWTITNAGTVANHYDVTLNWVAGDLDPGVVTSQLLVGKYDAPNWTLPTVSNPTATSIQAAGITSFSDLAVAMIKQGVALGHHMMANTTIFRETDVEEVEELCRMLGADTAEISHVAAAIGFCIGVDQLAIRAGLGDA